MMRRLFLAGLVLAAILCGCGKDSEEGRTAAAPGSHPAGGTSGASRPAPEPVRDDERVAIRPARRPEAAEGTPKAETPVKALASRPPQTVKSPVAGRIEPLERKSPSPETPLADTSAAVVAPAPLTAEHAEHAEPVEVAQPATPATEEPRKVAAEPVAEAEKGAPPQALPRDEIAEIIVAEASPATAPTLPAAEAPAPLPEAADPIPAVAVSAPDTLPAAPEPPPSAGIQAMPSTREMGEPDARLADDAPARANPLRAGEMRRHAIHPADDVDWFTFSLATAADVRIDLDAGNTLRSLWMALYDRDGKSCLAYAVGAPSRSLSYLNLPAGTYFIEISDHGRDQPVEAYSIALATAETAPGIDRHADDDQLATATPLLPGSREERAISPLGDVDWFTFTLESPAEVNFEVSGPASHGGIHVALFREKRAEALAYLSGPLPRTLSRRFLPAGVYHVRVSNFGGRQLIGAYAASLQVKELDTATAAKLALTYREPPERSPVLRGLEAVLRKVGDFFSSCREVLRGWTPVG